MTTVDAQSDAARLKAIRDRLGRVPDRPWHYAVEGREACFQRFLAGLVPDNADTPAAGAPIADKDRAAARLRSVLSISSRRELNIDKAAAERWRRLKDDFWNSRKRGRG